MQTSSANKHVDRKSCASRAGWYGLTSSSSLSSLSCSFFRLSFFAVDIRCARSLPSFDLHSRRSAFNIKPRNCCSNSLLRPDAIESPPETSILFLPARLIIQFTRLDRKQCRFADAEHVSARWSNIHREIWALIIRAMTECASARTFRVGSSLGRSKRISSFDCIGGIYFIAFRTGLFHVVWATDLIHVVLVWAKFDLPNNMCYKGCITIVSYEGITKVSYDCLLLEAKCQAA